MAITKDSRNLSINRRILYLAYFYPPAGGLGFPACQRITRFVKYLKCKEAVVLTVKPEQYPSYIELNNSTIPPVKGEVICRTRVIDLFKAAIAIRSKLINGRSAPDSKTQVFSSSQEASRTSYKRRIGDWIHDLLYFPDWASPWALSALCSGLRLVRRHRITMILATGMPWSAPVIGCILSILTGVPFVADFRDPWIGNPFRLSQGKLLDWAAKRLERMVIRHARLIIANTSSLRENMIERYPEVDPRNIITVPNGFDPEDIVSTQEHRESLINNPPQDGLIVAHAGFLYGVRDPQCFLEAQRLVNVSDRFMPIRFWQIGNVSLNYDIKSAYAQEIADLSLVVHEPMPYKLCQEKLEQADVLLVLQPGTETQIPSKLYDYLLLGKPILVIGNPNGALAQLVKTNGFGEFYSPTDIEGIKGFLTDLRRQKLAQGSLKAGYPNMGLFDISRTAETLSLELSRLDL
jgi:hypothetical protein